MAQAWIKTITADQIIKGRNILSYKPGIATHVIGNDKLRKILREQSNHVAIEIPADADRRWKRRKPAWRSSQ